MFLSCLSRAWRRGSSGIKGEVFSEELLGLDCSFFAYTLFSDLLRG
jgi:hypothetical protein